MSTEASVGLCPSIRTADASRKDVTTHHRDIIGEDLKGFILERATSTVSHEPIECEVVIPSRAYGHILCQNEFDAAAVILVLYEEEFGSVRTNAVRETAGVDWLIFEVG